MLFCGYVPVGVSGFAEALCSFVSLRDSRMYTPTKFAGGSSHAEGFARNPGRRGSVPGAGSTLVRFMEKLRRWRRLVSIFFSQTDQQDQREPAPGGMDFSDRRQLVHEPSGRR